MQYVWTTNSRRDTAMLLTGDAHDARGADAGTRRHARAALVVVSLLLILMIVVGAHWGARSSAGGCSYADSYAGCSYASCSYAGCSYAGCSYGPIQSCPTSLRDACRVLPVSCVVTCPLSPCSPDSRH